MHLQVEGIKTKLQTEICTIQWGILCRVDKVSQSVDSLKTSMNATSELMKKISWVLPKVHRCCIKASKWTWVVFKTKFQLPFPRYVILLFPSLRKFTMFWTWVLFSSSLCSSWPLFPDIWCVSCRLWVIILHRILLYRNAHTLSSAIKYKLWGWWWWC